MGQKTLEIKLISARDLNDVNVLTKMDPYVIVTLSDDSNNRQQNRTTVDSQGGRDPGWNSTVMKFAVDEHAAQANRLVLVFTLRCQRNLGDKDIGEVNVSVKELLDSVGKGTSTMQMQHVSYQVRKPSGKPKGVLNFSYEFYDAAGGNQDVKPVSPYPYPVIEPYSKPNSGAAAYPPPPPLLVAEYGPYSPSAPPCSSMQYAEKPPPASPFVYPPPGPPPAYGYPTQQPVAYPYSYPPQPGYGYPPPPSGYGYPPTQVQQPQKKNKTGMGLGVGLIGGMLGGLLIGDMVSDFGDGGF